MSNFTNFYFNYLTSTNYQNCFCGQMTYHGFKISGAAVIPFRRLPETDKNSYDTIVVATYEYNPGTHSTRWAMYLSKYKTLVEALSIRHLNIIDKTSWGMIIDSTSQDWYDSNKNLFKYDFSRNLIIGLLYSATIYGLTEHENEMVCVSFSPSRSKFKSFKDTKDFVERSMFEYNVEPGLVVWFINEDLSHNLNYKSKFIYTENHKLEHKGATNEN